jgi:hypothetical protein
MTHAARQLLTGAFSSAGRFWSGVPAGATRTSPPAPARATPSAGSRPSRSTGDRHAHLDTRRYTRTGTRARGRVRTHMHACARTHMRACARTLCAHMCVHTCTRTRTSASTHTCTPAHTASCWADRLCRKLIDLPSPAPPPLLPTHAHTFSHERACARTKTHAHKCTRALKYARSQNAHAHTRERTSRPLSVGECTHPKYIAVRRCWAKSRGSFEA